MLESFKIVVTCIAAAIINGVIHDQFTARICVEYFTVFHPPVFPTQSPTLLAFGWGIIATWWVGAFLGILLAIAARAGSRPKLTARVLIQPVGTLLSVMAACAILSGTLGYVLAKNSRVSPPEWVATVLPSAAYARFMADYWWAHNASYASGFFGGLALCVLVFGRRRHS